MFAVNMKRVIGFNTLRILTSKVKVTDLLIRLLRACRTNMCGYRCIKYLLVESEGLFTECDVEQRQELSKSF